MFDLVLREKLEGLQFDGTEGKVSRPAIWVNSKQ